MSGEEGADGIVQTERTRGTRKRGSGQVPGARTGNFSCKGRRRKRLLRGQGLGLSGLDHAAASFLVALGPLDPC